MWSDETKKIEFFGANSTRHVWRENKAELHHKKTIPTVKYGGKKNHALGVLFSKGDRATVLYYKEDEWGHVSSDFGQQSLSLSQSIEDESWLDL